MIKLEKKLKNSNTLFKNEYLVNQYYALAIIGVPTITEKGLPINLSVLKHFDNLYQNDQKLKDLFDINYGFYCEITKNFEIKFGEKHFDKYIVCAHLAIITGKLDLFEYLLTVHSDKIDCDKSVLEIETKISTKKNYIEFGEYCRYSPREIDNVYHLAIKCDALEIVKYLENKFDYEPDIANNDDYTPLELAIMYNRLNVLKHFLENHLETVKKTIHENLIEEHWNENGRFEYAIDYCAKESSFKIFEYLCSDSPLKVDGFFEKIINSNDKSAKFSFFSELMLGTIENKKNPSFFFKFIKKYSQIIKDLYDESNKEFIKKSYMLAIEEERADVLLYFNKRYPKFTYSDLIDTENIKHNLLFYTIKCSDDLKVLSCIENLLERSGSLISQMKYTTDNEVNIYHWTCKNGRLNIVKYLDRRYKKIIDPIRDKFIKKSCDAYCCAAVSCNTELLDYLSDTFNWDYNKGYFSPYKLACFNGFFNVVLYLDQKYGNQVKRDGYSTTDKNSAIELTCKLDKLYIFKYLEDRYFDVVESCQKRTNLLNIAAKNNSRRIFKYIYEKYVDKINIREKTNGQNVLHLSLVNITDVYYPKYSICIYQYLLTKEWDLFEKTEDGRDAFLCSIQSGNLKLIEDIQKLMIKIKENWNVYVRDYNNMDAYLIAATYGHVHVMKMLEKKHRWIIDVKDSNGFDAYLTAAYNHKLSVMKYLEDTHKWDENTVNNKGIDVFDVVHSKDRYNEEEKKEVLNHISRRKVESLFKESEIEFNSKCLICMCELENDSKYVKCVNEHSMHLDCMIENVIENEKITSYLTKPSSKCPYCKDHISQRYFIYKIDKSV